ERTTAGGEPLPDAPRRPAFAVGSLDMSVPPLTRTLTVTAEPRSSSLEPGAATTIDVLVVDDDGQAVADSEVALVVVDEAVLGLTGYQLPDPLELFYDPIRNRIETSYGRSSIVLADLRLLLTEEQRQRGLIPFDTSVTRKSADVDTIGEAVEDDGEDFALADSDEAASFQVFPASVPSGQAPQVEVRDNFDALALFAPRVITDASGKAQVDLELPDSLTRYRVMAVAVDGNDRFGSGEANLTARLPLMVRPSAPRFLNFGDRFELPVVIQNQTDEQLTVEVAIAATNLELTGPAGKRVTIAANDRVEVRFPAAADLAGTARFQVVAVSDELADAASIDLPVYTPATAEAFASYGVLDSGSTIQAISPVSDVYPEFGGLEITTSSTAVQSLTDAVLYLSEYPYQTSDALASRILAIVALRDVLQAFEADGLPAPEKLQADVQRDINKLLALQNDNGGFAHWQKGKPSEPYNSVQATHALIEANKAGFLVREQPLTKALKFVRSIEKHYPNHYPQRTRDSINSYALNVLFRNGEANTAKAQGIYSIAENLSLEATAWLWPVLVADGDTTTGDDIARLFNNRATETAAAATFATDYGEDGYLLLHSNRRTDAVILGALIEQRPGSALIAKVVEGLLAGRTRGRWNSIQENTFVLQALNEYFNTFEAQTPDFVARMWLGEIYAGEHEYRGRSADRALSVVAMAELIEQFESEAGSDIVISKDGPGRLYYRLGLKYAPDDLELDPLDRGFVVQRSYEAVDDPDDVRRGDDGTWHIEAGARVRVRLSMVADSRRTHVALIDPLPAGLESINPSFATSEQIPADVDATRPRWRNWFRHQNLRDDRTEAFTRVLRAGTYEYTYVARATTPGTFITPPARAEEMYNPETFGRSASAVVIIEDPT
ncbi:MAG: alpha-2-macroglobulin family protein, partial [Acidimicrobiales bacterium]